MAEQRKETAARDAAGVRKNTYRRFKEGEDYEKQTEQEMTAICDMMKIGIFGEEETPEGVRVKHAGGRPRKYETVEQLQEGIERYIDYINTQNAAGVALIPDVEGLALFLGVCRSTLYEWRDSRPGEFSDTIKITLNAIAAAQKQLGYKGKIPPLILAMNFNNNHGYTQAPQRIDLNVGRQSEELPSKEEIVKRITVNNGEKDPAEIGEDEDIL